MKIEILGTGCAKCKKTYEAVSDIVGKSGRGDVEVVKVEDLNEITSRGVMMTPAVMVDGQIKVSGKIPPPAEIEGWLK